MHRSTLLALLSLFAFGCSGAVETSSGSTGSAQHDKPAPSSTATTPPPACQPGTVQSCTMADGTGANVQSCDADGKWSTCGQPAACSAPQSCTTAAGQQGASCDGGACVAVGDCDPTSTAPLPGMCMECDCVCLVSFDKWSIVEPPCNTPLVLAFDGEPVEFTRAAGAFDLVGRELSVDTDWVAASTPWLAIDVDGNGAIDAGRELFGSMTELPDGSRARNGFEALAALDADGNGRITPADPAFARLVVWRDADQNRRSSARELQPASAAGLVAIDLAYRNVPRCSGGSCEVERARFVFRDGRGIERDGAVVDVHLASR
jgi:hypothetical protein